MQYLVIEKHSLDIIAPLWEKLKDHQRIRSTHFRDHYANRTWAKRKNELLSAKRLHVVLAKDEKDAIIGYCVSTISGDNTGTIESIYIEPVYRKNKIGDSFMKMALDWMNEQRVNNKVLTVGVGNEEVLGFYSRWGFFPRTIKLEQLR